MTMEQAEMPPPYSGDDMTAVAGVTPNNGTYFDVNYIQHPYIAIMTSRPAGRILASRRGWSTRAI